MNIALLVWLLNVTCNIIDHRQPGGVEVWNRGVIMGHGLQRMNRSQRGKLPIVIPEGNIRPLVPGIAAKYATECNIAVRNHVPVLKHWKEYKKHQVVIELYLGILRVSTFSKSFPLFINLRAPPIY